jgi:hypothetical protein
LSAVQRNATELLIRGIGLDAEVAFPTTTEPSADTALAWLAKNPGGIPSPTNTGTANAGDAVVETRRRASALSARTEGVIDPPPSGSLQRARDSAYTDAARQ